MSWRLVLVELELGRHGEVVVGQTGLDSRDVRGKVDGVGLSDVVSPSVAFPLPVCSAYCVCDVLYPANPTPRQEAFLGLDVGLPLGIIFVDGAVVFLPHTEVFPLLQLCPEDAPVALVSMPDGRHGTVLCRIG